MSLRIGIVDFNPDQSPDLRQYPKRIGSLIPAGASWTGLLFRGNPDISKYDALILSGSKLSATDYQRMVEGKEIIGEDYKHIAKFADSLSGYKGPVFGICFGAQLLAHVMGGKLASFKITEAGYLRHQLTPQGKEDPVFGHLPDQFYGAHLHKDYVESLPDTNGIDRADILATRNGFIHAYKIIDNNGIIRYGVQPHPEMSTPNDAIFLVKVNGSWLIDEIGKEEYDKALTVPSDADFGLSGTITTFVENLK